MNSEYSAAYEAQSLMTYLFNSTYSIPLPYDVESSLIIVDTNKRSINAENKIIVSPNPTSNSITIKSSNLPIKRFSISDLNGRVIISSENLNNTMLDINVDFLENGMYFVIITDTDNITHVEHLIVDKK